MGTVCWGAHEDWTLVTFQINLPNGEVEVMNCQKQVWEEWRSLKGERGSIFLFAVVGETDVLGKLGAIVSRTDRLDTPVD